jgi:antitoxin FitA
MGLRSIETGYEHCTRDELRRPTMASITIANIDDNLKQRLVERAAKHGHTIEVEACEILEHALVGNQPAAVPDNLYAAIRAIVDPLGGIELEESRRQPVREPPRFD